MKRKSLLSLGVILLLSSCFVLCSCQKRVDTAEQWRIANEKAFSEYADSSDYSRKSVDGSNAYIYMKTLKSGVGKDNPIETSRVMLHYQAYKITGDKGFIDGNYDSEAPARFALSRGTKADLITGMRIGLQNMVQGEEAILIIPWHLAYGASRTGNVPGYTAFRYIVRLDSIIPEDAI